MILMGIVHLPSLCDYWKKDSIFHYSPIADKITRDRFLDIHRYLHFNSNSSLADPGTPGYNKLGKVQPIIDKLSNAFQAVYKPHKDVSVDEAMIPFKKKVRSQTVPSQKTYQERNQSLGACRCSHRVHFSVSGVHWEDREQCRKGTGK